jgi:hypothetical protein
MKKIIIMMLLSAVNSSIFATKFIVQKDDPNTPIEFWINYGVECNAGGKAIPVVKSSQYEFTPGSRSCGIWGLATCNCCALSVKYRMLPARPNWTDLASSRKLDQLGSINGFGNWCDGLFYIYVPIYVPKVGEPWEPKILPFPKNDPRNPK